ncbi:hypothetical protein M2171_003202 [Bradyrhizobium japonicum USDA 38]|uniref:hypothetical protein n=1 Tax=Bradyrhizobium japonicum TaxID=375 RepID=UPI000482E61B|nr:hypothetical protein [Bradyrhizobium japonicum]MCS3894069.1 hypothetical protein [Bradyrhizobium japonicum USDA 38]MCS3946583.1 hypothetical protein [Bradyrhizobium japonicum]MCW2220642.1 hypothetical protein [Bradyrhizobium japonicum]MCW2345256.1 hypothetical protein [Bradyrhizobium japonicum]
MSSGIEDAIRRSPGCDAVAYGDRFSADSVRRSELALAATLTTVPFGGDTMIEFRLASWQGGAIALGSDTYRN